ncbi:hypothetical protein [Streptomyces cellulosae]|uniref:Secreted protein n=1 Tax=Streptomyces cellulosae TaxID=1968 RepID=A0ABW7YJN4_STRCE
MSGGMKASGAAARLVLLARLLGVGVLHTLSHAGAHGGVSAPVVVTDSHEAYPVGADQAGAVHLPDAAHVSVEQQERGHRAHAEATAVSDCFALIPSGSWLAPPPCTAVSSGATERGASTSGAVQDLGGHPARAQLSVLRI